MKLIKYFIFALFLSLSVISVFSQEQPVSLGAVTLPYKTAVVPPNNGTWQICSSSITIYVSYSVRVVPDSTPITLGFGTSTPGNFTSNLGIGKGIVTDLEDSADTINIPSLSCLDQIVLACDQDTGNIPIESYKVYCLVVSNPFTNAQTINVAFSGTDTVFEKGGFTSPNKSGGNTETFNNATANSSNIYLILCIFNIQNRVNSSMIARYTQYEYAYL
ncbi:hypothetical protein C1645_826317 [Glomus cerebriforme]|uniref:Uncharacterized protein n=1 Tax=Glomus cerebriforme TaxID=658196 RepID=A0A397SR36_9GLOM|nr:hypothetical protein C1645_826317 [Glomus cerebriforme]